VSDPQDPQEVAAEQVARTMTTPGQGPAPAFPAGAPERGGLGYLIQRQKTAGTPLQAAGEPFSRYDLTAVTGGAGWEADVGIAMVTLQEHEDNKHKSPDVVGDPSPNLEDYYRNSAPVTDLLGDVEAFGISMPGCSSLSSALRAYYLGDSRTGPGHQNRWHVFAEMSNLRYTVQAGKVIWKEEARKLVIQRIKAFADLYALREHRLTARFGKVRHQDWPTAGAFADRFLKDVAAGLGKELAAGAAKKP
jgi:hypothetical protein